MRDFSNSLYLALAVFGVGSLVVNGLAILYSLRPLDQARVALGKIRGGRRKASKVNSRVKSSRSPMRSMR